jgi:crossover junction endodeoxyribonuclease RuvC
MICGIDPGEKGAIALLYPDYAEVHDMPMIGKEVNGTEIADIFSEFKPRHIWLEQVNSFGMGRTSAFNFGQQMGVLKGVFQALLIPYTLVTPQKWQKHFGKSKDKDQSRLLATRLYPQLADKFKQKKDDGRAEALLIAKYGSEQK